MSHNHEKLISESNKTHKNVWMNVQFSFRWELHLILIKYADFEMQDSENSLNSTQNLILHSGERAICNFILVSTALQFPVEDQLSFAIITTVQISQTGKWSPVLSASPVLFFHPHLNKSLY